MFMVGVLIARCWIIIFCYNRICADGKTLYWSRSFYNKYFTLFCWHFSGNSIDRHHANNCHI